MRPSLRLIWIMFETAAIFNLSTQFGGGETHALALLYHVAQNGESAGAWKGMSHILKESGVNAAPAAATAVFVGTEFDSITGRGGMECAAQGGARNNRGIRSLDQGQ